MVYFEARFQVLAWINYFFLIILTVRGQILKICRDKNCEDGSWLMEDCGVTGVLYTDSTSRALVSQLDNYT
jgi:hypothetical protein